MATIHVQLYGRVGLVVDGVAVDVPAGRPRRLLVALAAAPNRELAVEELLRTLYDAVPASGLNALQRHVSALRGVVRKAGWQDEDWLQHRAGAYRLAPTVTDDLQMVHSLLDRATLDRRALVPDPGEGSPPNWWAEPVPGIDDAVGGALRGRLDALSLRLAMMVEGHGLTTFEHDRVAAALDQMLARRPVDDRLWVRRIALGLETDDPMLHNRLMDRCEEAFERHGSSPPPTVATMLHGRGAIHGEAAAGLFAQVVRAFLGGDVQHAQWLVSRLLDLDMDLAHRLRRTIALTAPSDGLIRLLLTEGARYWFRSPDLGLRCLVSVDAHALARHPDGLNIARREALGESDLDLARTERVLAFVRMHRPLRDGFAESVEQLRASEAPASRLEAERMAIVLELRSTWPLNRARIDSALQSYERAAEALGHQAAVEFVTVSRAVLGYATRSTTRAGGEEVPPSVLKHSVLEFARLWYELERGIVTSTTMTRVAGMRAAGAPPEPVRAMHAYASARGGLEGAAARLDHFRGELANLPPDAFQGVTLVAVLRAAREVGDAELAEEACDALAERRGEVLGLWPLDIVIGPADAELAGRPP